LHRKGWTARPASAKKTIVSSAPMTQQSLPVSAVTAPTTGIRKFVIGGVALAVVAAAVSYWMYQRHFEITDDAQVDGNISSVSPRVSGNVSAVRVVENQLVKVGDVLAEIDPSDLQITLDQAKAQVAQAQAQLEAEDPTVPITQTSNVTALASARSDLAAARAALSAARKEVEQLTAQLAQAKANDRTAQLEKQRSERLLAEATVPQSDYDLRSNAAAASAANVEALEQSLAGARDRVAQHEAQIVALQSRLSETQSNGPRQVATRRASVGSRQAALDLSKAQLAQAEKNLSYAKIVAPITGIVAKKAVAVGDHVAPGQQVIAISQIDSLWVTANYRETQLQRMQPGQPVTIHIDALDLDVRGALESIGGATGSRLSVLPPENASGNYVKVVQRIPVRVRIDPGQQGLERLRIGMSAEPKVTVR
jgi:membrane fusion protein (multidrug efflux system)